jgi:hypothetical protein
MKSSSAGLPDFSCSRDFSHCIAAAGFWREVVNILELLDVFAVLACLYQLQVRASLYGMTPGLEDEVAASACMRHDWVDVAVPLIWAFRVALSLLSSISNLDDLVGDYSQEPFN